MAGSLSPGAAQVLADVVLLLHFGLVLFVVLGLPLIALGNRLHWRWVNRPWFRGLHLATIGIVVAEAWCGITCPLTTWEQALRLRAASGAFQGGFIEHWVQRLLFHDAPPWVFVTAYTLFGALVAAAWWRWPPRR